MKTNILLELLVVVDVLTWAERGKKKYTPGVDVLKGWKGGRKKVYHWGR